MRVTVSRGRVAASVQDSYSLPGKKPSIDWLGASAAPSTSLVVPGLSRTADERTLVLANPGDTGGRVEVRITGKQSTFAPAGLEPIEVPAGQVVITDLTERLQGQLADGEDTALQLTSTVPVTALDAWRGGRRPRPAARGGAGARSDRSDGGAVR